MDAIDNPSYFSLPSETHRKSKANFLRKWSESRNSATLPVNPVTKKNSSSGLRRNFRSLLRANSEDAHLLAQGKPRPSDLAPSIYLTRNQRHRSFGNVISSDDLLHQDMVHCGGVSNDDGDVFLPDKTNAQYYNVSTLPTNKMTAGRRRHSIASFLNRDRSFNSGNEDNRPKESLISKKFIRKNIEKVGKMEEELDILLVSCGDGETSVQWVNYLISCFQQISKERNKPSFKLQSIKIEDIVIPLIGNEPMEKYPEARLQIVIICPLFLQKIQAIPDNDTSLGKLFRPEKVVALMLGAQERLENDHIRAVIPKYEQWRKMTVKDMDRTSVEDFLGVAMDILSKSWQIQEALNAEQQLNYFSIIPKKVKVGQNKLIILLTEPLSCTDEIKIFIDKSGQRTEVGMIKKRNPFTIQFTMPSSYLQVSLLVNVCVEKNGRSLGRRTVKCESKMRELDQMLRSMDNPIQFMCQSFGLNVNDREQLDAFLSNVFQKNYPPNFNLLNPSTPLNKTGTSNEEFPTLLHFTAKYGLEKLSWLLMESPGGDYACQIRNCSHLTPAEIAERANHSKLSNVLKGYLQMTELSSVYYYLKGFTEKEKNLPENNYILPRPLDDTYLIPPAARPVEPFAIPIPVSDSCNSPSVPCYMNFKPANLPIPINSPTSPSCGAGFSAIAMENYEIPRNGRPCTPCTPTTPGSPIEKKFEGYLEMNSTGNEPSNFGSMSSFNTNGDFPEHFGSFNKLDRCEGISSPTESHASSSKYGSANHLSSREKLSPEDELLEIITDFKNEVFTIAEVEALVESWQNRNDVQQSFRDRQEKLIKMREEYDRIQRKMREQMKRSTPFERIRKFFSRKKSKSFDNSEKCSITSDSFTGTSKRPGSNISLQSSSSSASSRTNSLSNGSAGTMENAPKQLDRSKLSLEKLNTKKKSYNNYVEIPTPSQCTDTDASDYVQPDCVVCKTRNRLSSSSSFAVSDTIHECVENDNVEMCSNENITSENQNQRQTYHFNDSSNIAKVQDKHRTYSLRLRSKKKMKKIKNKVKSAENLISDGDRKNIDGTEISVQELRNENKTAINSGNSEATDQSDVLSTCETLCAQAMKCIAVVANNESQTEVSPNITFQFDKMLQTAGSSTQSECGSVDSRQNSSLDLSSLSLNSNCTVDENGEIKCSLELKITEEDEIESEAAPPVPPEIQRVNICTLPEYANVNIQNSPSLPRRCKYTIVSS